MIGMTRYDLLKIFCVHCSLQLFQEMYKGLGIIFTSSDGILLVLIVPFVTSAIYVTALFYIPTAATTIAFSITGVSLALVGILMDLDKAVMMEIPLFKETHPLQLMLHEYFRWGFYLGSLLFFVSLLSSFSQMTRAHAVFRECVAAIGNPNVLVTIFTSMVLSVLRIAFIIHVCRSEEVKKTCFFMVHVMAYQHHNSEKCIGDDVKM